ncbi:hypothetical protein LTR66_006615 [Elasticomyces elasticus]|nr:hypothetical protein LTR66_006615 [Elasticomyces elasticus]
MARKITVAAAQVGAVHRDADRKETVDRLVVLLREAAAQKVQIVVFPECTLTTFFPRYLFESQEELDKYFEPGEDVTTSEHVKPLAEEARKHNIDFVLGYAERTTEGTGYNTCIYYSATEGKVCICPGTKEPFEDPDAMNQLEKRYFEPGNLGFQAFRVPGLVSNALKKDSPGADENKAGKGDPILGMLICNDRRWPEAWRGYSLQGVEPIVFGFNTGSNMARLWGSKPMSSEQAEAEALFHSRLVQQAISYMNACFSISSARCGSDDGKFDLIAGSAICNTEGHLLAEAKTKGDEVVVADIDLSECRQGKEKTFDFARHRRIETYALVATQTGVVELPLL